MANQNYLLETTDLTGSFPAPTISTLSPFFNEPLSNLPVITVPRPKVYLK